MSHGDTKYLYARISASDPRTASPRGIASSACGGRACGAFEESIEFTLKGWVWRIEKLTTGDNDDVERRHWLARTKHLAGQTLRAIAQDGAADLPRRGDAKTRARAAVFPDEHRHQAAVDLDPGVVGGLEVRSPPDVLVRPERSCLRDCWHVHHAGETPRIRLALVGDGQPLSSLGATPLEDLPAVFGLHPDEKAVSFLAPAVVGLKRAYALGHYWIALAPFGLLKAVPSKSRGTKLLILTEGRQKSYPLGSCYDPAFALEEISTAVEKVVEKP